MVKELIPPSFDQLSTGGIAKDFDVQYGISDLVINAADSNGRPLHVNREFLSYFSPYFRNLLATEVGRSSVIEVEEEYWLVRDILRVLHNIQVSTSLREYYFPRNPFISYYHGKLDKLAKAALKYGLTNVWKYFYDQFVLWAPLESRILAVELGMKNRLSYILRNMALDDINKFLNEGSNEGLISPDDALYLLDYYDKGEERRIQEEYEQQRKGNRKLFKRKEKEPQSDKPEGGKLKQLLNKKKEGKQTDSISHCSENVGVSNTNDEEDEFKDFDDNEPDRHLQTEPVPKEYLNVVIKANDGEVQFNKSVLATFSPYFRAMFFTHFDDRKKNEATMDTEIKIVKEILKIMVDWTYNPKFNAEELAELYRVSDQYDIPFIRALVGQHFFCIDKSMSLEVAIRLNLEEEKKNLVEIMTLEDIQNFLCTASKNIHISPSLMAAFVKKQSIAKGYGPCERCDTRLGLESAKWISTYQYKEFECEICGHKFM